MAEKSATTVIVDPRYKRLDDEEVIKIAKDEGRISFTLDKNFGFLARRSSQRAIIWGCRFRVYRQG